MPYQYDNLHDIEAETPRLPRYRRHVPDLRYEKLVPAHDLTLTTAERCAERLLGDRDPTYNFKAWLNSWHNRHSCADCDAVNQWFTLPIPSTDWRLLVQLDGVTRQAWGNVVLATTHHETMVAFDRDNERRRGMLGASLAYQKAQDEDGHRMTPAPYMVQELREHADETRVTADDLKGIEKDLSFHWKKDDNPGGVVFREFDSRGHRSRMPATGSWDLPFSYAKNITEYYLDKARAIARSVANETTSIAASWDEENPEERIDGFVFAEKKRPPMDVESLLIALWDARRRKKKAEDAIDDIHERLLLKWNEGVLEKADYVFPDLGPHGKLCLVRKPTPIGRVPNVQYYDYVEERHGDRDIVN